MREQGRGGEATILDVLRSDQAQIGKLFDQYMKSMGDTQLEKEELAQTICEAVTIHRKVEEEVLYPEIRKANDVLATALKQADLDISRRIVDIRENATDPAQRDRALMRLLDVVGRRAKAREQVVFPFVQWRFPADTMRRLAAEWARRSLQLRRAARSFVGSVMRGPAMHASVMRSSQRQQGA